MKKLVLTLAMVAGFAFAANNVQAQNNVNNDQKQETTRNIRPGFVDNNGDGVCDNYDGNRPGKGLGPGNGNGQGRVNGNGLGRGNGRRYGSGPGAIRNGQGGGAGYVDTNNNGTCDNLENGTARQRLRDGSGGGTGRNKN